MRVVEGAKRAQVIMLLDTNRSYVSGSEEKGRRDVLGKDS